MMATAFPNLDELAALARKTDPTDEDRERIREILRTWPASSLALLAAR